MHFGAASLLLSVVVGSGPLVRFSGEMNPSLSLSFVCDCCYNASSYQLFLMSWAHLLVRIFHSLIGSPANYQPVVASVMTAALLGSLCYKPNKIVVGISLLFSALNLLAIFLDWWVFSPIVEYLALFYGVFIGYYSVRDIYDDLITRTAEGSDAVACSEVLPCCHPRCIGVQFWIVAFAFQALGLYFALVWMWSNDE